MIIQAMMRMVICRVGRFSVQALGGADERFRESRAKAVQSSISLRALRRTKFWRLAAIRRSNCLLRETGIEVSGKEGSGKRREK